MAVIEQGIDRTNLPAAGEWSFDLAHSRVGFVARHLMVTKVRGQFARFDGTFTIGEDPTDSAVDVTIDVASISTGEPQRDGHLLSPDFFDAENYPTIRFRSTGVRHAGGDQWALDGELTVKDVTRPVTLDVEFEGIASDPWGNEKAGFSASVEVDREAWGLTWNQALETGGVLVSKKVKIEIDVELVKQ